MIWGYVEAGVGVIVTSLPMLRPIFDMRLLRSISNTVCLKLSFRLAKFPRHRGSDALNLRAGYESYEMPDRSMYENSSPSVTIQ